MEFLYQWLCLVCALFQASGQILSGKAHGTTRQTTQPGRLNRHVNTVSQGTSSKVRIPETRQAALMGNKGSSPQMMTMMPGYFLSKFPSTRATMAPGIQRSSLGSPHPFNTNEPRHGVVGFLMQTTPSPRLKMIQSVSAIVRKEFVPPAQERIPIKRSDQPSHSVTVNSPFRQLVNSRGTEISQTPSSNTLQNGPFSPRGFPGRVKHTHVYNNLQNARIQQQGKEHAHTSPSNVLQNGNSNQHSLSSRTGPPRTPPNVSQNLPVQQHMSRVKDVKTSSRIVQNPQHQPSQKMKHVKMSLFHALQSPSFAPQNAPQNRIDNAQTSVVSHNQPASKNTVPITKKHGQTAVKMQNQSGHQLSTPIRAGHTQTSSNVVQNPPVLQHIPPRAQTLTSVYQNPSNLRHVLPRKIKHTNDPLHSIPTHSQQLVNSRGTEISQTSSSNNGPFSSQGFLGGVKHTHVSNNLQNARIQQDVQQQGKEHVHASPSNVLQNGGRIHHSSSSGIEPPQNLLDFLQSLPTAHQVPGLRDVQTSSRMFRNSSIPQYDPPRKIEQVRTPSYNASKTHLTVPHKVASSSRIRDAPTSYAVPQNLVPQTVTPRSMGHSQTSSTGLRKPPFPQHEAPQRNERTQTLSNIFQTTLNPQKSTMKMEQAKTAPPYDLSTSHTSRHVSPQGMEHRTKALQTPSISNRLASDKKNPHDISSSSVIRNQHTSQNQIKMENSHTLSSNIIRKLPVYQNVAARKMEPRQTKSALISSTNIVESIPFPLQETRRVKEPRGIRHAQTSPSNALYTSPIPNSLTPGRVEWTQKTSPNSLINGRQENVAPKGVENAHISNSNILLNLLVDQQELPQGMKNAQISSANIIRHLPVDQQVLPRRMKHKQISSANIVRYLPIDERAPRRQMRHVQFSSFSNVQIPNIPKQMKSREINNMQFSPPNTLSNVPVRQEAIAKEIAAVQTPSSQKRAIQTKQQQKRQVISNSQLGEQANSKVQTTSHRKQRGLPKAQPVPTIINGKKYMVNPLFIGLLKNYFANAGLDMKTGHSKSANGKKTAQNVNMIDKKQRFQTKSQGKRNEIKMSDTQTNNGGVGKGQNPFPTRNVIQARILNESSVNNQKTQTQDMKTTRKIDIGAHPSTKIPNARYTTKATTHPYSSSLSNDYSKKTTQPHTPYVHTIRVTSTTTKPTTAWNTARMRSTPPPSSIPKPSQPQSVIKTTTHTTIKPPLPVTQTTTTAPKRRKALLMPFRKMPVKQMITQPITKPTPYLPTPIIHRIPSASNANISTTLSQNLSTNTPRTFTKEPTIHAKDATTTRSTYPSMTKVTTYAPTLTFQPSGGTQTVIDTPLKPETQLSNPFNDSSSINNTSSTTKVVPSVKTTTPPGSTPKGITVAKNTTLSGSNKLRTPDQLSNPSQKQTQKKTEPKGKRKEQTTSPIDIPKKKPVNVRLGFELNHFRHTDMKSQKESNKLIDGEGVLFGDIFRYSNGLHPSGRVGVHKGFAGFNNRVNDVELLVLR
ncbi:mucin-17-like [Ostrea edulis]|uniref:mucin-17-like n=1 Tax=Ostrea edulis TaxID=37623 RepID=UPI0024AF9530|nr:mucin-17-like [Ostrea edulis]